MLVGGGGEGGGGCYIPSPSMSHVVGLAIIFAFVFSSLLLSPAKGYRSQVY